MAHSVILQVVDCGRFWAQNADADCVHLLNNLHMQLQQYASRMNHMVCLASSSRAVNPFSPTLFLIVAKVSLPKHSAPYWSNPPFLIF